MKQKVQLDRALKNKINQELDPGEKIQWIDRPAPAFFTPKSTPLFLFGIPSTIFALFWVFGTSGFKLPDFSRGINGLPVMTLFGLPFILIGIGMLLSPLWAYFKSTGTIYLITNRRALIIETGGSLTIQDYPPEKLQDIYHRETRNGKGDVILSVRTWEGKYGKTQAEEIGFLRISNPMEIEQMLAKLGQ